LALCHLSLQQLDYLPGFIGRCPFLGALGFKFTDILGAQLPQSQALRKPQQNRLVWLIAGVDNGRSRRYFGTAYNAP
jgi:hypothetical protein